ncbi:CLUMA_CG001715, isoform A [Clunio marinus]|uniref:CLUMA_CG001715, isoform A n=1 Tax=Clunio marinus TaxID=568069 RepID=A0A1J1HNX4_9DIPT|nr:CLUMA_CG001715, isoform A [Clunio marinus]
MMIRESNLFSSLPQSFLAALLIELKTDQTFELVTNTFEPLLLKLSFFQKSFLGKSFAVSKTFNFSFSSDISRIFSYNFILQSSTVHYKKEDS